MKKNTLLLLSMIVAIPTVAANKFTAIILNKHPIQMITPETPNGGDNLEDISKVPYIKFNQVETSGNQYSTASFAIDTNGTLWSTGNNTANRLGLDSSVYEYYEWTKTSSTNVTKISAGFNFTFKQTSDGKLYAIGNNRIGQFGNGTTNDSTVWIELPFPNARDFSAIGDQSYVIDSSGKLWVTGDNRYGQLGIDGDNGGAYNEEYDWTQVTSILPKLTKVYSGYNYAAALDENGNVWMTGDNADGQLGSGDNVSRNEWVQDTGLPPIKELSIGATGYWYTNGYTLAQDTSGYIWHTGSAIGTEYPSSNSWVQNSNLQIKSLKASDSTAYLYGVDNSNMLHFIGDTNYKSSNDWVSTDKKVKDYSPAGKFGTIIDENGFIWVIGSNDYGQIGLDKSQNYVDVWTKPLIIEPGSDTDNDGVPDVDEITTGTNPDDPNDTPVDTDGDGIYDPLDDDIDGDGFYNEEENTFGSDPMLASSHPNTVLGSQPIDDNMFSSTKRTFSINKNIKFYDNGGSNGNYIGNSGSVFTFVPPKGKVIGVKINYLELNNPRYSCCNSVSATFDIYKNGLNQEGYLNYDDKVVGFPNNRNNPYVYDYYYISENNEGSVTFSLELMSETDTARGFDIDIFILDSKADNDNDGIDDFVDTDDDNDGYLDSDEIYYNTDPLDANSHPSFILHSVTGSKSISLIDTTTLSYYDDGGSNKTYSGNINSTTTTFVSSDSNKVVKATINKLETEANRDYITIYNGENALYEKRIERLLENNGQYNNKEYFSDLGGALTFEFYSDSSGHYNGWDISIQMIDVDQTDTDSDGVIDFIDNDDDNDGYTDELEIAEGTDPLDANSHPSFILQPTSGDKNVTLSGSATSFYDNGGKTENYSNNVSSNVSFIASDSNNVIKITINSLMVEDDYDFLKIYDGDLNGTVLENISSTSGNFNSKVYYSTSDKMTFNFSSDGSENYDGWDITVEEVAAPNL